MKLLSTFLASAVLLLAATSSTTSMVHAQSASCPQKLCSLLAVANNQLSEAFAKHDVETVVAGFQEHGGTLYPGNGAGYQSRPVLKKWFEVAAFAQWQSLQMNIEVADVVSSPNAAWEWGQYNFTHVGGKINVGTYFTMWGGNQGASGRTSMAFVEAVPTAIKVPAGKIGRTLSNASFATGVELASAITVAFFDRKLDAVNDIYFPDAVLVSGSHNQAVMGRPAIASWYKSLVDRKVAAISLVVHNVQPGGPYSVVSGEYRAISGDKPAVDGPTTELGQFFFVVAMNEESHKFQIVRQMSVPSWKK